MSYYDGEGRLRLENITPPAASGASGGSPGLAGALLRRPRTHRAKFVAGTRAGTSCKRTPAATRRATLARSLFFEPTEPQHLQVLSELRWDEGDFAESAALSAWRRAPRPSAKITGRGYFVASRHLRETDTGFTLLEARFQRLGEHLRNRRTLYWARRQREEHARAREILDEALAAARTTGTAAFRRDPKRATATRKGRGLAGSGAGKTAWGTCARRGGVARTCAASTPGRSGPLAGSPGARTARRRPRIARSTRLLAETDPRGAARPANTSIGRWNVSVFRRACTAAGGGPDR